jgi:hypothetical protein
MKYDIIGDIHGCSKTLEKLLLKLGYGPDSNGVHKHADRTVIFLGDFIDRGPHQREVIDIVRPMIESGAANSVMGNHEYNAIAYATPDEEIGGYLRAHSENNWKQHGAFIDAYAGYPAAYADVINWFKTLPLWLDLGDIRIIHACWDKDMVRKIGAPVLTDELLHASCNKGLWQYDAIETILKGKEIPLPDGHVFHDKDENARHNIRVRWWDQSASTYLQAYMGPESARTQIPDDEIAGDHLIEYSHEEPPVFLGHYWMEGAPEPLAPNIACTDYSVAKPGGKLVAYRWVGERNLASD